MGHRDSSSQFGGRSGFSAAESRIAAVAAASSGGRTLAAEARGQTVSLKRDTSTSSRARLERAGNSGTRDSARTDKFSYALLILIRAYVIFLSPFFGGACKFEPSCSNYANEAIARHGAKRGAVLALKRLLRCRPFTTGGFDPVPNLEPPELANSAQHSREPV